MFGSQRVTVAGRGDLHGETGRVTGKALVTDPDTRGETEYVTVRLDGEGHDRLIPPGNLRRGRKR